ncbi:MAG TPA: SWIM zinc finger family protein, partial [Ktedonobacterales bacterium]|nr:SWIM zinc finger family protein [Ktedonobacterales bacterium]
MAAVRQLNEQQIRDWVGDASYRKGQPYAREGGILHPRRQGSTLLAQCQGSLPTPYRITAKLGARGVTEAECSCPVGADGHCKHVAALLITWMNDPARFAAHEPLERMLERLSKEELIVVVRRMVRRDPNLEDLIELPVPGGPSTRLLDAQIIRRQVTAAFDVDPYEWGVAFGIKEALLPLVELGD